jgi:RNA polymerase sigma-70 factor (ECF subfamily)
VTDTLEAVFRREAGRCTATLIRVLGDIDLAEDAVAEAFAIAAQRWSIHGIPPNPGGWITTTARNRAIDRVRREKIRADRQIASHRLEHDAMEPNHDPELDDLDAFVEVVADDQLRLMFLCCHPALNADAQVALTLRLLGGLETDEIARAFLVPEATMAQRIVRAKRKLRDNHVAYRIPRSGELPDRLHTVLGAIYLIYTEGHTASSGPGLSRIDLCREAIRLGRVLVELMPDEPEAVGLLALMLLTEARGAARTDAQGAMVRLADQDRMQWDRALISEGHRLVRACLRRNRPGAFQIQAAIAAVHADAPTAEATDWSQIIALYDQLYAIRANPVVALNRAIAIAALDGPEPGLVALDALHADQLDGYQPYHAARADLLVRAGKPDLAVAAYDRALQLTTNRAERDFLIRQRRTALLRGRGADGIPSSQVQSTREEDAMSRHGAQVDRTKEWDALRAKHLRGAEDRPPSSARGVHHFALLSGNVEATIGFYQDVLEFPLTELFENRDYQGSTHFFFDVGNGNLLAFFDFPGLDLGPYAEVLGGLHHIAISVTPERWEHLRSKLERAGVATMTMSGTSLYFNGPDGERLELIKDPLGEMYGSTVA